METEEYDEGWSNGFAEGCRVQDAALAASAARIEAKDAALRHARTFIENRFSMLSPEQRSTVDHINAALDATPQPSRED